MLFFFFKQKTAYEMRISDWSSDVCSSDLSLALHAEIAPRTMFYMRYQEGFRPGGLAIESDFVRRFRNDRTATFEFGARHGQAGTSPFNLALSLSYTRWKDIQAAFIDSAGLPSTANIGNRSETRRDGQECVRQCKYR